MTSEFKGTSQLALVADDLPVHARVGLALVAADLALAALSRSADAQLAYEIFTLAKHWHDGKLTEVAPVV